MPATVRGARDYAERVTGTGITRVDTWGDVGAFLSCDLHRCTHPRGAKRTIALFRVMGPRACCGRYWVRTSDLLGVNEALYH